MNDLQNGCDTATNGAFDQAGFIAKKKAHPSAASTGTLRGADQPRAWRIKIGASIMPSRDRDERHQ
jgi:hypothetical protein